MLNTRKTSFIIKYIRNFLIACTIPKHLCTTTETALGGEGVVNVPLTGGEGVVNVPLTGGEGGS